MRMGCSNSKKLASLKTQSNSFVKTSQLPEVQKESRELWPAAVVNNEMGKSSDKKGRVVKCRVRFDPVVTESYEIKALIGRGSFSRVVRVEHKQTKQPYAIKMIKVREGKEVFESELAVLRKVKHAYIVQLYESYECRDRVYLVMELATGGELFDRIVCRGYFTEWDATRVMFMVLDGVRYLHSLGITHRDLKPENLLYYHPGNESKIMITDFGLSNTQLSADDETMDTICGTPEYIAPEILMRKPYTNAVDVWAIGVITFILLSGQMPFAGENRPRLYRAILRAKYSYSGEAWKDVSDNAKDFIHKLLVLDPEKRMTAESGLKHPWITSSAASSSLKNLQFSQNWLKSSTSRVNSARSNCSQKSNKSSRSGKSAFTLRRSNGTTLPQDTKGQTQKGSESKQGGSKSSGLKDSNVKLTKQLVEKLHSVINEDERELLPSNLAENESAETGVWLKGGVTNVGAETEMLSTNRVLTIEENEKENVCSSCNEMTVDCLCQQAVPQEFASEERQSTPPISIGSQRSSVVMRDNFLSDKRPHSLNIDTQCEPSQSNNLLGSFTAVSPNRFRLSPVARNNKVFCSSSDAQLDSR